MRYATLVHTTPDDMPASLLCRGGVGGSDDHYSDYALEIGHGLRACPKMLALCVHVDEIHEILQSSPSSLSAMLRKSLADTENDLRKQVEDSRNYPAVDPLPKEHEPAN
tara:strand:+ start:5550 stop:5876 length:327 start_codon:yes stop_codon:yes gene_type:complete